MELNWTTFILEIINFLVLMWILQRFLYKPVLAVIARRRAAIEQSLEEAKKARAEASELQQQYEGRLSDWERQRQAAHAELQKEIEAERKRLEQALQRDLGEERKKVAAAAQRRQQDQQRKAEETALRQGAQFAARLLEATACQALQDKLLELLLSELEKLPEEKFAELRGADSGTATEVRVSSAFPLGKAQQGRVGKALAAATGLELPLNFDQDAALLAGLRITVGAWVLAVNLRDELQGFAEMAGLADASAAN